jgi:RHS repeat-associated protein
MIAPQRQKWGLAPFPVTANYSAATRHSNYFRVEVPVTHTSASISVGLTNLTNDGRWMLTWDGENRLVQMESQTNAPVGSKLQLKFGYDAQGRRIQKIVSGPSTLNYQPSTTNRLIYDGWNLIVTLHSYLTPANYFYWGSDLSGSLQGAGGVGGMLWARFGPVPQFAAYDGNGNVMALVHGTSGALTAQYEYGPFGELLTATGSWATSNPFRFSTKYQDSETGHYYYGYRFYNAATGRWLNRDPIDELGGANLYSFIGMTL